MKMMRYWIVAVSLFFFYATGANAQKFLPDDPIINDPDNLSIPKPTPAEFSPSYDTIQNSFGFQDKGELLRAQNINTLGDVPDSSWFTNRIGIRNMTPEELARGANQNTGPDTSNTLTVIGAGLYSFTEGLIVQDSRGDRYYLIFDPKGMENMATGAAVVANKFFYAIGYNVLPVSIAAFDLAKATIAPNASIGMLGGKQAPLDQEFLDLFLEKVARREDGKYRAAAYKIIPQSESIGEFQYYGTRSDDANDIIPHQDRRELRGMGVFASWLNYDNYNSMNTMDRYETESGSSFVRHYLIDFSTALGSGNDLDRRIIPKDKQAGNEYIFMGDLGSTLKTALTLGIWMRPWMKVEYPAYPEIGNIEADFFQPDKWRPAYPNPAYARMLPDDAFWATKILARFSDEDIRTIVRTGEYRDAAAERYLIDTLIKRRNKIIAYYFKDINPLDHFAVHDTYLEFGNLGQTAGLADNAYYEYSWYSFDNKTENLTVIEDQVITQEPRLLLPKGPSDFLMVRIQTRSQEQRGWRKNVAVYLRMAEKPLVVGIDREVGAFVLDRDIQGRLTITSSMEFGGTYKGLNDDKRRLVDNWFRRFNEKTGRKLDTEAGYDNLPLSTRTTFEAVTHALSQSGLSDDSGRDLGLAIDLIDQIETVNGRIQGVGGDEQFRIYVTLKPDAVKILESSREFKRGPDNTVFHKNYPINYRQQGKEPTMQISIGLDETRADVDVDYRSSKFPAAVLNGHLTASNSDVRAGNNYSRHIDRWQGFANWWRGLFGLPFVADIVGAIDPEKKIIPLKPRKGDGKLEEAVEDWLRAWFMDSKPEEAVAYLSNSAFACMEQWSEDNPVDYGISRFMMVDAMASIRNGMGTIRDLNSIIKPETLKNESLKPMRDYRGSDLFTLYEAPEDLALAFDCANRNKPVDQQPQESKKYGKYFGSVFQLNTPAGKEGGRVILLWAKEDKHWKILSYEVDPGIREVGGIPDMRSPAVDLRQTMAGDPEFLTSVETFFTLWGMGQIDGALGYFDPESYDCVKLYLEGEVAPGAQGARDRLQKGLQTVYDALGKAKDIADFAKPVEFIHPDFHTIEHPKSNRYSLAGLPDFMGASYRCNVAEQEPNQAAAVPKTYGTYYAAAIQFNLTGEDAAVLYLLWAKVEGAWKIIAFRTVNP